MLTLVFVVLLALAFDFINGFHDAANSIATVVSTRVLIPRLAVLWAAFFNFIAFLVFSTHVAGNIAKGVDAHVVTLPLVAARAARRDRLGPAHVVVGPADVVVARAARRAGGRGDGGARIQAGSFVAGLHALDLPFFGKTALFIVRVADPRRRPRLRLHGARDGALRHALAARRSTGTSARLQLVSAALYSLGHGGNDAQKTMGIIVMALVEHRRASPAGTTEHPTGIPFWVVLACHAAMGARHAHRRLAHRQDDGHEDHQAPAGRRLLRRDGGRDDAVHGDGASASRSRRRTPSRARSSASGSVRKLSAVRWGVAGRIVWAWVLTVPGAALIAGLAELALTGLGLDPR